MKSKTSHIFFLFVLSILQISDVLAHSISNTQSKIRKSNQAFMWMKINKKIHHLFLTASYLKICHRKDPHLNQCVQESIEKLRPKLAQGIKELLLPSCEPLEIPQIAIKQNAGAISMESVYSDILVYGLTNFTIQGVR